MENERERIEQTLFRLLEYRKEHDLDQDSMLIMLSLLNLMGLVNALNRGSPAASSGGGMQALLGPLLAMMAAGMGGGTGGKGRQINPAALLGLLGGMQGGGQNDLAGILGLLGPLLGMGAQGQKPANPPGGDRKQGHTPRPVQREIDLDRDKQGAAGGNTPQVKKGREQKKEGRPEGEQAPCPGEVLEWKFGL